MLCKPAPAHARRRGLTALGLAGLLLAAPAAWAQDGAGAAPATAPPPADEAAPAQPAQLHEVVVTATKRSEALRDIPESITSLSGEELEKANAQGAQDIAKLVPGV